MLFPLLLGSFPLLATVRELLVQRRVDHHGALGATHAAGSDHQPKESKEVGRRAMGRRWGECGRIIGFRRRT